MQVQTSKIHIVACIYMYIYIYICIYAHTYLHLQFLHGGDSAKPCNSCAFSWGT